MTQITNDHVEWAVVNRLQKMLENTPNPEFNVTHTYALFVPILCWTSQRIRTKGDAPVDKLAKSVLGKLKNQEVEGEPWSIPTENARRISFEDESIVDIGPFPEFRKRTAAQLVINLRDSVAHGDARNVTPFPFDENNVRKETRELLGFTFECNERDPNNRKKIVWSGTITLLECDMRRIGVELAKAFCRALRSSDEHRHDSNFGRDAAAGIIEKKAA